MMALWAAIVAAIQSARIGSAVAAVAVGAVSLCAVGGGVWLWLYTHDNDIRTASTAAVQSAERLQGLLEERKALQRALGDRRTIEAKQATDAAQSAERIDQLEQHNAGLRDHVAKSDGDGAIVFRSDDRWLQDRRTGARTPKAGGR